MTEEELVEKVVAALKNDREGTYVSFSRAAIAATKAGLIQAGWKGPDGPIVVKGAGGVSTSAIPTIFHPNTTADATKL